MSESNQSTAKAHNANLTGAIEPETVKWNDPQNPNPSHGIPVISNPMRQLLVDQAIPQLDMIVKIFDAGQDESDPKGQKVRDAAMAFRDALKDWAT